MTEETQVSTNKQGKPKWLAITFFVLTLLYLIPEVVFNAKLVEVAGGMDADEEALHLVELFGRSISGIGVTLLIADLLLKGKIVKTIPRTLISFAVVAAIVWPTVFFGQKLAVDKILVEPSTAKQRQEAFFSSVLRSSLAANAVQINGLPYIPEHATSPTEMTFLAMMGGLVYANDDFIVHVEDKKRAILNRYIENRANNQFEQHFTNYKAMRVQVVDAYKEYQQGVKRYNQQMGMANKHANEGWEEIETQIAQGWKSYQNAEKAYLARAEARAQDVASKIFDHFKSRNRCIDRYKGSREQSCIAKVEKSYAKTLSKAGIPYVDMDYWLTKKVKRTKGETSFGEAASTLGLSAILAGLEIMSGDSGKQDVSWIYTNEVAFYTPRILNLWKGKFEKETGYPMGIENIRTFRSHPVTSKKVRERVKRKGIHLKSSWTVAQITTFKNTVKNKVRIEVKREWNKEMAKRGIDMKPNLSWKAFQTHSHTQQQIASQMGQRNYVKPMMADWNNKQFYNKVIKTNIQRETEYWLRYIESARSQFADGGPLAENGKSALRSIIVPPISMSLSLLLILLTVVKLPFKFWALIDYDKPVVRQPKPWEKFVGPLLSILVLGLVFVIPLTMGSSKFTKEQSTTSYFLDKFDEKVSPVGSLALKWVLHTQPVVQPVGARFDQNMRITELFKTHLESSIHHLDTTIMAKLNPVTAVTDATMQQSLEEQRQAIQKTGQLKDVPFAVKTNVKQARIRVLNIGPVYKSGMELPAGNYHVEVSAPGYKTTKKWVSHGQNHATHTVNIESL
ncbi:hypothetical protein [Vibrio hippocampi]|uniref:PEGA domain-containing protein n=1 Tax=Vibrio hippocampi TaxID=654686 RepID=A0ABM8ZEJ9_9VIBR|nr:hypothetical protein [Vibrio hippocampi]CAH0524896.1 hypothetical protein VHP8226_00571 [Vibrio hippocampi]